MRAVTLLYHDAFQGTNPDESGFPGPGSGVYKLHIDEMRRHFVAIAAARGGGPVAISTFLRNPTQQPSPWLLTFDDGGVSAVTLVAGILNELGWTAHFLITASCIDAPRFVTKSQVRDLRGQGHVIGSHSWSHPARMSHCGKEVLTEEWRRSTGTLGEILGEPVTVASVPGGYFSRAVAEAAAGCGIQTLFTSEPVKKAYQVQQCTVLGRFTIRQGTSSRTAAALASARLSTPQALQYSYWNLKKAIKLVGGRYYIKLRAALLQTTRD